MLGGEGGGEDLIGVDEETTSNTLHKIFLFSKKFSLKLSKIQACDSLFSEVSSDVLI